MRLALVRQRYNPYGGAERFVERALEALAAEGVALTLITRRWSGASRFEVVSCDPLHLGRLWRDWSFRRCVEKTISGGRFDLVQSHERIPGCDIYRAGDGVHATWIELLGASRGPLGRLALTLSPWHRYILAQEGRMFRDPRLRAVICNSRLVRDDIGRRFGVSPDRLHVIHNGVDVERFHPGLRDRHRAEVRGRLGLAADAFVIVFVGSGFERKGVGPLLQALARLADEGMALVVVGHDKAAGAYGRTAQRLGVGSSVRFVGGQKDVRPYYGAADLFALPTLYDPFPNAALEALACGLPVVTTATSGAAELLGADTGTVLPERSPAVLAQALSRWRGRLAAPDAREAAARAARASVEPCSVESMTLALAQLYRTLLRREAAASAADGQTSRQARVGPSV